MSRPLRHTSPLAGLAIAILLLLAANVATPAAAQGAAGTIVFVVDDNVWIMAADDPGSARPVTSDGTAANPYRYPSQDDAGRIMAVRGPYFTETQTLVLMDQTGTYLQQPFRPSGYEGIQELSGLDMLPTGEAVALTLASTQCGEFGCSGSDLQASDGNGSFAPAYISPNAAWYSPTQVVAGTGGDFTTYQAGEAAEQPWFEGCALLSDDPCRAAAEPEIDRTGTRLITNETGSDFSPPKLHYYELNGLPPAAPTHRCTVEQTAGSFYSPTWSPDGTQLVVTYGEGVFGEQPAMTPGIYVLSGFDGGDCAAIGASLTLLIEGAYDADWSAAPLGATPGGPPPTDPTLPPGEPGRPLVDGERVDGGGSTDPIGQAITTSQLLFPDGTADRVVLATADQFPDALAGSALAGDEGPILFTSGQGGLDPRTRAEIERVTGGSGVVLTLGGPRAVSDQAAAEARGAGGNQPCTAPLPSSCRYAGAAREQTAALISATVLVENPGQTALIARRDDFADAITGGAYAARAGVPILLTPSNSLHPDTEAFLRDHGISTSVVLGGTAAIDQPTFEALPTPEKVRVAGAERTATAVAIAQQLWEANGFGQGSAALLVNVRDPNGWHTALSAAVASAVHDAPQVGVESPPTGLSAATRDYLAASGRDVVAFGGTELVSDAQLQEAMQAGRASATNATPAHP